MVSELIVVIISVTCKISKLCAVHLETDSSKAKVFVIVLILRKKQLCFNIFIPESRDTHTLCFLSHYRIIGFPCYTHF